MSSKPRIIAPNLVYQITAKGPHDIQLFHSDDFRIFFVNQLSEIVEKYCCICLAFAIIKNQYYLVLKSGELSISKVMQCFNSILAKRINKINGRDGAVFRTRFRSVIVEEGEQIKDLIRFVHLEPVNNGECSIDKLDSYKWCSHIDLIGSKSHAFLSIEYVLKFFSGPDNQKEYRQFIYTGLNSYQDTELVKNIKDINSGKTDFQKQESWILGSQEFVQDTLKKDRCRRARIARHEREKVTFQIIQQSITNLLDLDSSDLLRQGKFDVRSTARELFVYTGKYLYDFTGVQLANYLKITESAVSKMLSRFDAIDNKNYLLKLIADVII